MSIETIQARIASIGIALGQDLDADDLKLLNAELDRLLILLIEMNGVRYE